MTNMWKTEHTLFKSNPQFHTDPSVQHISSRHGQHLFSTENPSVQHQKPFSLTRPSVQHTPQFNINWRFLVLNWGVCWTEGCFKLRGAWTERFLVFEMTVCWYWTDRCAELWLFLSWTDVFSGLKRRGSSVLNCECVELRGPVINYRTKIVLRWLSSCYIRAQT